MLAFRVGRLWKTHSGVLRTSARDYQEFAVFEQCNGSNLGGGGAAGCVKLSPVADGMDQRIGGGGVPKCFSMGIGL